MTHSSETAMPKSEYDDDIGSPSVNLTVASLPSDTMTLLIKHVPSYLTQGALLALFQDLTPGIRGRVDLFWCPFNSRSRLNLGYAIINFKDTHSALQFHQRWANREVCQDGSGMKLQMGRASLQGLENNVSYIADVYRQGVVSADTRWHPLIWHGLGLEAIHPDESAQIRARHLALAEAELPQNPQQQQLLPVQQLPEQQSSSSQQFAGSSLTQQMSDQLSQHLSLNQLRLEHHELMQLTQHSSQLQEQISQRLQNSPTTKQQLWQKQQNLQQHQLHQQFHCSTAMLQPQQPEASQGFNQAGQYWANSGLQQAPIPQELQCGWETHGWQLPQHQQQHQHQHHQQQHQYQHRQQTAVVVLMPQPVAQGAFLAQV